MQMRLYIFGLAMLGVIGLRRRRAHNNYPNRVIKLIVPFAAGGNTEVVERMTAAHMQSALNAVMIETALAPTGINRGGALATAAVMSGEVHLAFSSMSDTMGETSAWRQFHLLSSDRVLIAGLAR